MVYTIIYCEVTFCAMHMAQYMHSNEIQICWESLKLINIITVVDNSLAAAVLSVHTGTC